MSDDKKIELWIGKGPAAGLNVTSLEVQAIRTWCARQAELLKARASDKDDGDVASFLSVAAEASDKDAAEALFAAKINARANGLPYASLEIHQPAPGNLN